MKSNKILPKIFIFGIISLLLVSSVAVAQQNKYQYKKQAGKVEVTTPNLAVKITGAGNVPHFHFWNPNDTQKDYHVMFVRIFEFNDTDNDGTYTIDGDKLLGTPLALPSENWDVSEINVEKEGDEVQAIHFNFTNNASQQGVGKPQSEVFIQLRMHVYAASSNEIKFDVIISDWNWESDSSYLALQYTITESEHDQEENLEKPQGFQRNGTKFQFSQGYMEYEEEAKNQNNNTLQVKASYGEGMEGDDGESVYLAFENFKGDQLIYDPTLGINPEQTADGLESIGSPFMWVGLAAGAILGVIIIFRKMEFTQRE
ncbi:MAG: conserved exported protein of unknown function [Promethearchaeota archaeon]|nr:MAG: conserved exported protein of unknown function [Candidatus Lokiarchaeota archaeon]